MEIEEEKKEEREEKREERREKEEKEKEEEEKKMVQDLESVLREGESWFLVHSKWFSSWKNYSQVVFFVFELLFLIGFESSLEKEEKNSFIRILLLFSGILFLSLSL